MNQHSLPPVLCIGITGGIGSGKSYLCQQIEEAGHHVFYCDKEAKQIIRHNPEVMESLRHLVGEGVYDADGQLVKSVLAAFLCKGKNFSRQVDAIVHPKVAEAFHQKMVELAEAAATEEVTYNPQEVLGQIQGEITLEQLKALSPQRTLFMECALLFESGFDILVDASVLVHVSSETQINRLMNRDQISREKAQAWIDLQLSEDEKLQRASAYIVNE